MTKPKEKPVKPQGLVPAPGINFWAQPVYKPEPLQAVRPGADDHKVIRSRGMGT